MQGNLWKYSKKSKNEVFKQQQNISPSLSQLSKVKTALQTATVKNTGAFSLSTSQSKGFFS